MCGLLHTWILIFDIAIPYLRPNKATNWNFLVPRGLFVTKSPCSSPFSPAQHNCRREESPNMWHTYLGQVFIFLKGLRRVIMKTEVRKMIFGHAVIAWIFLLIFYFCKIKSFGHSKVRFQGKKQKDMADDGMPHLWGCSAHDNALGGTAFFGFYGLWLFCCDSTIALPQERPSFGQPFTTIAHTIL